VETLLLGLIGFVVVLGSIIPNIVLLIYYILCSFFVRLKKKTQKTSDQACVLLNITSQTL